MPSHKGKTREETRALPDYMLTLLKFAFDSSAEETAAWRYRLNWSSTFGLMIRDPISIETSAISLLSQAFEALDSGEHLYNLDSFDQRVTS